MGTYSYELCVATISKLSKRSVRIHSVDMLIQKYSSGLAARSARNSSRQSVHAPSVKLAGKSSLSSCELHRPHRSETLQPTDHHYNPNSEERWLVLAVFSPLIYAPEVNVSTRALRGLLHYWSSLAVAEREGSLMRMRAAAMRGAAVDSHPSQ